MQQNSRLRLPASILHNKRGQSAVEYLVVCAAVVSLLLMSSAKDSVYHMISHTIRDKYSSYAFAVSISDPPSKAFDDTMKRDSAKVKKVLHELTKLEDFIGDVALPDIEKDILSPPNSKIVKDFKDLVEDI